MKAVWILFLFTGCTMTVQTLPLHRQKQPARKIAHKPPVTHSSSMTLVDSAWLANYKKLESDHGDYTILDDSKIASVGGKFRVSKSVMDHYQDLTRAKATATPAPQVNP